MDEGKNVVLFKVFLVYEFTFLYLDIFVILFWKYLNFFLESYPFWENPYYILILGIPSPICLNGYVFIFFKWTFLW